MLPVCRAADLTDLPDEERWLVDELWADRGVGIVGGEPKCCKSFLALDIAVAVASGTPCLRRFPVSRPGRVLLYAAEDALHVVRARLEGIAHAAGVQLQRLDIQVITVPTLRLDNPRDRQALEDTVAGLKPVLLILDPFVRLHRIDENAVTEVAPLLAYLRHLERLHNVAVLLVHHARKGGAHMRGGQALRGSSELHAWGDSNLYLRRKGGQLHLAIEHRAAPSPPSLVLELRQSGSALALAVHDSPPEQPQETEQPLEQVVSVLASATTPMTLRQLQKACRIRNERVSAALAELVTRGEVVRTTGGYRLRERSSTCTE